MTPRPPAGLEPAAIAAYLRHLKALNRRTVRLIKTLESYVASLKPKES